MKALTAAGAVVVSLVFDIDWTTGIQQASLFASDAEASDSFGKDVAISGDGNAVIVGASGEDTGGASAGAAYIFTKSGTTWSQEAKIQASDKEAGDYFAHVVDISADGNTALIGAPNEDTGAADAGAAYIFTRSGTTWSQEAKIQASDKQASDLFGISVALSGDGNTAIVGASGEDSPSSNAGAAYAFTRTGSTWSQQAKLPQSSSVSGDAFGSGVAVSGDGDIAIVCTWSKGGEGSAYKFTRTGSTWVQAQEFQYTGWTANGNSRYGWACAISSDGTTIAITAIWTGAGAGTALRGRTYIFTNAGSVVQQAVLEPSDVEDGDGFGRDVSLSSDGNTVVVGAIGYDDYDVGAVGAAYIFTRDGTTWTQQKKLQHEGIRGSGDFFGYSVGMSANSDTAISGAHNVSTAGSNAGAAYIFVVGPLGTWITNDALAHTLNTPNSYGDPQGDFSAQYSTMEVDGGYGIVGCIGEDSANGTSAGAVYMFNMSTGGLVRSVLNPNTTNGQGDQFGLAVDYDSAGDRAIIGAPGTDVGGVYGGGAVYLYSRASNSIIRTVYNPTSTNDSFGSAVAVDGSYMAVAANNARTPAGESAGGLIYVYHGSGSTMNYQRTIQNPNHYGGTANARDQLSRSMKIIGNKLIVSAFQEDDASGINSGVIYIFSINNGVLLHTLVNPNPVGTGASDYFGNTFDAYGDTLITGAYGEEGEDASSAAGRAYIYSLSTGALLHTLENPNHYDTSRNDNFGKKVSIAESRVFVAATGEDDASGSSVGIVYAYDVNTGVHIGTLENPNDFGTAAGDGFGNDLASDGDYLLVAASGEDTAAFGNSQRFYIFDLPV